MCMYNFITCIAIVRIRVGRYMMEAKDLTDTFYGLATVNMCHTSFMLRCAAFDAELADLLKTSVLQDTLVILMADHGIHNSDYTKTPAGGYEWRNPFLYMLMPKSHETAEIRETLHHNKNKLVTHQDFHQTQVALMTGKPGGMDGSGDKHAHDLLTERVSKSRTCAQAGVDSSWCLRKAYTKAFCFPEGRPSD